MNRGAVFHRVGAWDSHGPPVTQRSSWERELRGSKGGGMVPWC